MFFFQHRAMFSSSSSTKSEPFLWPSWGLTRWLPRSPRWPFHHFQSALWSFGFPVLALLSSNYLKYNESLPCCWPTMPFPTLGLLMLFFRTFHSFIESEVVMGAAQVVWLRHHLYHLLHFQRCHISLLFQCCNLFLRFRCCYLSLCFWHCNLPLRFSTLPSLLLWSNGRMYLIDICQITLADQARAGGN